MTPRPSFMLTAVRVCTLLALASSTLFASASAAPLPYVPYQADAGPALWVTPLELDFGEVGVGQTSVQQTVTITNIGDSTLADFAGGAPFDTQFGASQNCAGGVAPGASCTYTFSFTPSASGVFSTTSNSSTNAGPFVIGLRGEGVGPKLWVTPQSLDFGPVATGVTSPQQIVTITNLGRSMLADFAGGAPSDPQFGVSQNCAGGVAPGASCNYFFTFTPSATGTYSTTSNSSTNAGPFSIELRGDGSAGAPIVGPGLWVTPLELDFGEVGVGQTSAQQIVTITNTGDSTLTDFAGGAPFDPQFGAFQDCAGGVAPGASCTYTFSFTPTASGVFSTTSNSSTNAGPFVIALHGEGVGPKLWVTPTSLDFGPVATGVTSPQQIATITNLGRSTLTNFAGGAPFDPQFGATQNCAGGVAPGASCNYTFSFTPSATGTFSTTSNSSSNAGPFIIKLRGQSGVAAPSVDAAFVPDSIRPGDSTVLRLRIHNPNVATTLNGVVLAVSLPAGLTIADAPPAAASFACGTPSLGAAPSAAAITLSGARIFAGQTCEVTVPIDAVGGTYTVTTGAVGSDEGGTGDTASATLNVMELILLPSTER
jgi:hypothetical protein